MQITLQALRADTTQPRTYWCRFERLRVWHAKRLCSSDKALVCSGRCMRDLTPTLTQNDGRLRCRSRLFCTGTLQKEHLFGRRKTCTRARVNASHGRVSEYVSS